MRHIDSSATLASAVWRKSSRSGGNGGQCVEIATLSDAIAVRDSKDPAGPALLFRTESWRAFAAGVAEGRFDR